MRASGFYVLSCSILCFGVSISFGTDSSDGPVINDSSYLKRFGRGMKRKEVESLDVFPSAEEFYVNYVIPGKPVIFKNAAPTLGTLVEDLKFINLRKIGRSALTYSSAVMVVGNSERRTMSFRTFAKEQKWGFLMINGEMPIPIREQVALPPILNCSEITNSMHDTLLTLALLDYQAPIRSDPRESLMCQMNGGMYAILISPDFKHKEEVLDLENGTLSSIDIVQVDMFKYSFLEEANYWEARFGAGDCFYTPSGWLYQLNNKKGDTSFTLRWGDESTKNSLNSCNSLGADTTLADVRFPGDKLPIGPVDESGLNKSDRDVLSYLFEEYFLLDEGSKLDYEEFLNRLKKDTVLLEADAVLQDQGLAKELFTFLDKTSDGYLDSEDVDAFSESQENLKPTATNIFELLGRLSLRSSMGQAMKQLEDKLETIIEDEGITASAVKRRVAQWHQDMTAEWMEEIRKVWLEDEVPESSENRTLQKDEL